MTFFKSSWRDVTLFSQNEPRMPKVPHPLVSPKMSDV